MTQSFTTTRTVANTVSNTRHLNDKIAADLENIRSLHPNLFSEKMLEGWKQDFFSWIKSGYAEKVGIEFKRNGKVARAVYWAVRYDGSITVDDNTGRLGLTDLDGMIPSILVYTNAAWDALTDAQQHKFYSDSLSPGWGPLGPREFESGSWREDKQYSKGELGLQRSVYGGRP